MIWRSTATIAALVFAVGGFVGAGPTPAGVLNPFGWLFVGIAALVWLLWEPFAAGLDRPGLFDAITRGWMGLRERKRSSS